MGVVRATLFASLPLERPMAHKAGLCRQWQRLTLGLVSLMAMAVGLERG